jgi:hypothetical protein
MFQFNPGVNDMSGQILGQGVVSSAQTTADAQVKMVDDIGSALVGLAGAYGEMEGNKAKGRAFKDAFKVIAPSAGIDMKQLEALTGGSLKNDMDWYNARETMVPMLPSLINAQLGSQRNMTSQAGQQIQAGMPAKRAGIDNATDVAGGRKTYNPPDLFNVVPPPTPMGFGNINQGMPGVMGGQSMRPATQPMAVRPGR